MSFDLKKDPWYIRVNSHEESAAVQEWLFEQGITWWRNCTVVQYTFSRYLTNSYSSGNVEPHLMYGTAEIDKFSDKRKEIKVVFEKVLQVEKVIFPEIREKIEIGGKQYYKEDVEKARKKASNEMESAVKGYGSWEICADLYDAGYRLVGEGVQHGN